ncbi:flagellar protein FliS [Anaerobacterium chartisolvens]|uniref:Flagellar secretion chaperone FliS n=1 Tax=Anaerobacterium chartisolvens TaxID=1297424 RepID=A0A369B0D1_9FIRM|nr:flagellar export chaperone FliS [Anaerobacterium chartisolvens]RCX14785.1 flagellar protein FliS [Anaerobacterium chartisolvens]
MALNKAYSQYKENSIFTSSPEELTLMLYNGLVKFIMQAQHAIGEKNIEKANNCIIRAQEIVKEFQATLDMKYDISQNLMSLYEYMERRLLEANLRKRADILEEVLGLAKELRDTWIQAVKNAKHPQSNTQHTAK